MKLTDILNEIENSNPDMLQSNSGRRDMLKTWGTKLAKTIVPVAGLSMLSNKSSAKTTDVLSEAIVFAQSISFMQAALYTQGLSITGLIPDADKTAFQKILADKKGHSGFWSYYLYATGNPVPTPPAYDFTAKGALPKAFTDYGTFLTIAQAMEDVGVRMYLTAINELVTNKEFRSNAVNMATTNARHAAHVRFLRRNMGIDMMPWIAGTQANSIVGEIIKAYQEEDVIMQLNNNVVGINGFDVSFNTATEAFDEPIQRLLAEAFMKPYIA